MATAATLRGLSDDQLLDELASAKKEMFNLRFAFATGELDSSAQMAATKRDVARILTVLREREIAAAEMLSGASQGSAAVLSGVSQGSAAEMLSGVSQGSAAEMLSGVSQGSAAEMLSGVSQGSAAVLSADTGVAS